jgi:hypothetical protein
MPRKAFAASLLAAAALGACTLAPRYERPALPVAPAWPVAAPGAPGAPGADLAWREVFPDPRLQSTIALALEQNRDLRIAVANIARARAQYRIQRAELLPGIDAVGSANRSRTPAALSPTGSGEVTEQYAVTAGFSAYELDLFGRVRSLSAAALQSYFATEENRRTAQIALIAEVAADYLTLAADQDLLTITEDTLASREAALELSRKRFDAGATSICARPRPWPSRPAATPPWRARGSARTSTPCGWWWARRCRPPCCPRANCKASASCPKSRLACPPTSSSAGPTCWRPSTRCRRRTPTSARRGRPFSPASV